MLASLHAGARDAAANPLVGFWVFESASYELPEACNKAYLNFLDHYRIEGSDGVRKGVLEYSLEQVASGRGYNLIVKRISNDGNPSCYGREAETQDPEELLFFYVMLSPDGDRMKFYLSNDAFHVYRRVLDP